MSLRLEPWNTRGSQPAQKQMSSAWRPTYCHWCHKSLLHYVPLRKRLKVQLISESRTANLSFKCDCAVGLVCSFNYLYLWIAIILIIWSFFKLIFKISRKGNWDDKNIYLDFWPGRYQNINSCFSKYLHWLVLGKVFFFCLWSQWRKGYWLNSLWVGLSEKKCGKMLPFHMCMYIWLDSRSAARWQRIDMNKYQGSEKNTNKDILLSLAIRPQRESKGSSCKHELVLLVQMEKGETEAYKWIWHPVCSSEWQIKKRYRFAGPC